MRLPFFSSSIRDGFLRMGRGIDQRHARCAGWWEPHLRCSREFIARHVRPGARCAVLGAGRLLDVDIEGLLRTFGQVELFDADSSCLSAWRAQFGDELGRHVIPRMQDLTEVLGTWSAGLRLRPRGGELTEYLLSNRAQQPSWSKESFDTIISLNVLGQIPLYWRDFVREECAPLSDEQEGALYASMSELQRAHVEGLFLSRARQVVALYDSEYYFYESSHSEWSVEEALFGAVPQMVCSGEEQDGSVPAANAANKRLKAAESWLWHIAPQFVEQDDEGEIHKVEARVWEA